MIDEFVYNTKLKAVLSYLEPGLTLDVGCGDKRYTNKMPDSIGIDPNEEFEGAINKPDYIMKAEKLNFPNNSFHNICFLDTLEHIPEPEKAISEAFRVVEPQGCMIIVDPNDEWLFAMRLMALRFHAAFAGNPDHVHWFNQEDIVNLTSSLFALLDVKRRLIFNVYKFRSYKV